MSRDRRVAAERAKSEALSGLDPSRFVWLACLVGCLSVIVAGCNARLPGKPNATARPISVEKTLVFNALYRRNCAGCHGQDGMHGPAVPLNDPFFRSIVPQAVLETVLKQGRKQGHTKTAMAPFVHDNGGPLSTEQVQVLVHEIKGLSYRIVESRVDGQLTVNVEAHEPGIVPEWGIVAPAPAGTPLYSLPKTTGNAMTGAQVFTIACANCHGSNGAGIVRAGKLCNKINDPTFLALISDQEIRRIIITGRPDLKMPSYSEKLGRGDSFQALTAVQIADLGALLAEWRKANPK